MPIRLSGVACLALLLAASLPAQTRTFPVSEVRPGMVGTGRTVFEGDRLEEFQARVIGLLRNSIGPRRDLILVRLEGGPLADTGVIAGMSGSPVYIDGRLLGAVAYSLGEFSKEPIAGITPIDEMLQDATLSGGRPRLARTELALPLTQASLQASLLDSFARTSPFAGSPADVRVVSGAVDPSVGALLRPIATPLSFAGFDGAAIGPMMAAFRAEGFVPVMAGAGQAPPDGSAASGAPLRPGDPIGVSLMTGDLEIGATGTVTQVDGDRVYAFGHPFYGLGPIQFPMTRAHVMGVLPSLSNSMKIATAGEVIGVISQDRATTIAGTLGPGPAMIPISLTLDSERGISQRFQMSIVNDQLLTPVLAYTAILDALSSYERQNGVGTYALRGEARIRGHAPVRFEDLFTGDQPSGGAASSVVSPINLQLRNAFEDVQLEGLDIQIEGSELPRSATIERVWVAEPKARPGETITLHVLLRTYRGDEVTRSVPLAIPAHARGAVSIMVADGVSLAQWEARELPVQPLRTASLPQMIRVLNNTRRNNRLYVRLVTRDGGAVVNGEPLAALPPSVLAVIESDRNGSDFRPLQSAVLGEWELTAGYAVAGARTLALPLDD
jgi:hypothetical protein